MNTRGVGGAYTVPAVVVGAGVNGLGVLRSLARSGVKTWIVGDDPDQPGMRSRYGHNFLLSDTTGEKLVDGLLDLSQRHFQGQRPVLFLTRENDVSLLSRVRGTISASYRLVLPEKHVLAELMHKDGFYRLAVTHDAPVPRTLRICDDDDLKELGEIEFPAILKPGRRDEAYSRNFKKAYRVANETEAVELCGRILPVLPDLVLQEWIEGSDSDIYFCLQYVATDGAPVASFTGRKIRSWPPEVGGTASCMPAPEAHSELDRMTTEFFRSVGFVGMGSMEYKRDRRTGRFRMVEPTVGRTDYQEEVATLNGVNLPLAAYCHQTGLDTPHFRATSHVIWRNSSIDRWSRESRKVDEDLNKQMSRARVADALWRSYDPAPWLHTQYQRQLGRVRHHIGRRMRRKATQESS